MNCPFCLEPSSRKSREHLFSVPVCRSFGIDREGTIVRSIDGQTPEVRKLTTLAKRTVRLPCEGCNNGWMSELEVEMAAISRWADDKSTLGNARCLTVQRWMLKMLVVLAFSDGDARRFFDTPTDVMVPDIGAARAAMGERAIPEHAVFGVARTSPGIHLYGIGNPTVEPVGPNRLSSRAANVAAVNLGSLQLWVVNPLVAPRRVQLPPGVSRLGPRLSSCRLRRVPSEPPLELARVVFLDLDPEADRHVASVRDA